MTSQENVSKILLDHISIVNYNILIVFKPKDPLSLSSIKTYNGRLKSMKIKDYYNIDEIE